MLLPQPLLRGRLVSRYKRFFADVELEGGQVVVSHCANPGAMLGLKEPGLPVWISAATNPARLLKWDLQFVELPTGLVGINTAHPNRIVAEALANKAIPELAAYENFRPEVRYGENSRVDFLLTSPGLPDCYVEVKNVHFSRTHGLAEFPDSRTERGAKHLLELSNMVAAGHRAVMLYLIQRGDCTHLSFAADLDPAYAGAFEAAKLAGVEALAYSSIITPHEIGIGRPLSI